MKLPFLVILSYAAVYIIWGSTYFFIAMAVESVPVSWLMAGRYLLGGLFLTLFPLLTGGVPKAPTAQNWVSAAFLAFFLLLLGNGLVSIAEQSVDSSLAAIIIACTPFFVALMNALFHRAPLTLFPLLGAGLGVAGILGLLLDTTSFSLTLTPGLGLILLALLGWSFGTSWGHKMESYPQPLFSTGLQMLFAGALCALYALFFEGPPQEIFAQIQPEGWLGLLYLTLFGSLGIVAYNYLLTKEPSFRVTSHTLVNPVIAVLLGVLVGEETLTANIFIALPLILLGLVLMLMGPRIFAKLKKKALKSSEI